MPQRELPEYIFRGAVIIFGVAATWIPLWFGLFVAEVVRTGARGGSALLGGPSTAPLERV
jgi:hypothetical protein